MNVVKEQLWHKFRIPHFTVVSDYLAVLDCEILTFRFQEDHHYTPQRHR